MDNFHSLIEAGYEDASVPSIADLEKLALPDFNTFGHEIHPFNIMDIPKVKTEPTYEESPRLTTQRHFNFSFAPTPSTPLYSPAVTSNQSSPASYTDEDFSEEDKSFGRSSSFQMPSNANILNITDDQLAQYSARDINRLCKGCPEEVVKQLKKRRRTLKNRGYASNSRVRRLQQKNELETTKKQLQLEVQKLRQEVIDMRKQRDYYKNRAEVLAKKVQK